MVFAPLDWADIPDVGGMSFQDAATAITDAGFLVGSCEWVANATVPADHVISQYPLAGFKGAEGVREVDLELSIASEFSAGDGSAEFPYEIDTTAEWAFLAANSGFWDKQFILIGDIDFAGAAIPTIGAHDDDNGFTGVFDGNGHVVKNVRIYMPYTDYVGLFSNLGGSSPGHIRNLGVENASMTGDEYVGGIAGYGDRGSISGCYVTGDVTGRECVGGLVGWACSLSDRMEYSACYSTANVTGDRGVGGFVGVNSWAVFRACYSTGPVVGNSRVGGLVGFDNDPIAFACFWDIDASGQSDSAVGAGKTTAEMKDIETYPPIYWDFTTEDNDPPDWLMPENDYPRLAWEYWENARMPDVNGMPFEQAARTVKAAGLLVGSITGEVSGTVPIGCIVEQWPLLDSNGVQGLTRVDMVISYPAEFSDGNGTEDDPYEIAAVHDWILLADSPEARSKHLVLTDDLDFHGGEIYPVGTFSGVLDGNGHVVRNVLVDMSESDFTGLIGFLYPDGEIVDMKAENVHIRNDFSNTASVGGLVGVSQGNITNCYATGWVEGKQSMCTGGLVGANGGSITACFASSCVRGGEFYTGGLAGSNSGSITHCYAHGWVDGAYYVAGLVAYNSGSISDSYATDWIGYGAPAGGLVGRNTSGTVTAGFWDTDSSGCTTSDGGEGKSTGEMQDPNTFVSAGWDFVGESANGTEDIWTICEGTNYPRLVWQIPLVDWVCPDGVGLEDFGYFGGYWGSGEDGAVNLDGEDGIGFGDLMVFCEEWLVGR